MYDAFINIALSKCSKCSFCFGGGLAHGTRTSDTRPWSRTGPQTPAGAFSVDPDQMNKHSCVFSANASFIE